VHPGAHRRFLAQRPRLADQQEERRLKGVLCGVLLGEHPATDAPNQRSMSPQQRSKSSLVALLDEALQQLGVAAFHRRASSEPAQVSEERRPLSLGHAKLLFKHSTLVVRPASSLLSLSLIFCLRLVASELAAQETQRGKLRILVHLEDGELVRDGSRQPMFFRWCHKRVVMEVLQGELETAPIEH